MSRSKYRHVIHGVLHGARGPMSAREVFDALEHTEIGIATVYRILRDGARDGSLKEVSMPSGGRRFEPSDRPLHQHFTCEVCQKVYDIESSPLLLYQLVPEGFKLDFSKVLLFGHCPHCQTADTGE